MSCSCIEGKYPINIIQGDSYRNAYTFYDKDGEVITAEHIGAVYWNCARLEYQQELEYNVEDSSWIFYLSSTETADFAYCKTTYDLTLYFTDEQVETEIYSSELRVLEKKNKPSADVYSGGEPFDVNGITTNIYTGLIVTAGGGGTNNHAALINRNLPNQHPMSAITGLEEALEGKADADDIPTVNDGVLTIKQNGVTKGSFGANSAQNIEINLDGGSGGQGWTAEQITLLETVFANIVYTDPTTGQEAARQLIESLRGVVPSEYDITQVGNTLIISRAPATKSNDTLIIT